MSNMVVAIDGPSASGKSTVARTVARQLDLRYLDSGALYRAVTWHALRAGLAGADAVAIAEWIERTPFGVGEEDNSLKMDAGGKVPADADLRSEAVVEFVSDVAAVPQVRRVVGDIIRTLASREPLVVEGRDIGTVVFPHTPFKFFIYADPEERARRRAAETGCDVSMTSVSLQRRDQKDSSRSSAPLRCAADAVRIDTTRMPADQVAGLIARIATKKQGEMNA